VRKAQRTIQMDALVIGAPVGDARACPLECVPPRGGTIEMERAGDAAHGYPLAGRAGGLGRAQLVDHAGQPLAERDLRLESEQLAALAGFSHPGRERKGFT
jgi:hypothetical protein